VTTEEVRIIFSDDKLFVWQEDAQVIVNGVIHYLYQIKFLKDAHGQLILFYPDGGMECIACQSKTRPRANKRFLPSEDANDVEHMDDETQSAQHIAPTQNNTNQLSVVLEPATIPDNFVDQYVQAPPQVLSNGTQIPANEALIVNILLLVPEKDEYIQMVQRALERLEFKLQVSSINQQYLYSQNDSLHKQRHVIILPYGKEGRYRRVEDYLRFSSEAIVVLENETQQEDSLMAIERVRHTSDPNNIWEFTVKTAGFSRIEICYSSLDRSTQKLLLIDELRDAVLGGASFKKNEESTLDLTFEDFMLEWMLRRVTKHVAQKIYLCFKYEPLPVKAYTEYASVSLTALGIDCAYDPVAVNGSVLVYIRCPSYIPWYILARKDDIFDTLAEEGLKEIYECFISDVEVSMQRPDNEEFVEELTFLKEQMIADRVKEKPTSNK
jgi:hypothetical protein